MSRPAHPYIPNSAPAIKAELMAELGIESVDELYASVPERLRVPGLLSLPPALESEWALERHVTGLLARNAPCSELLSFLGAGCWQHYVPAICDDVAERAEFLTAYWGGTYTDRGKYQAFFECASLVGELVELDAVSLPVYDWGSAAAVALRMAGRVTGRRRVIVAQTLSPERRATILTASAPDLDVELLGGPTGVGPDALAAALGDDVAAVYVEVPSYLGVVDGRIPDHCRLARQAGALSVVGVDPISLGVVAPPGEYGADIVCGELQPLGVRMDFGGGLAGFLATRDEPDLVGAFPTFLIGAAPTDVPGEIGFGLVDFERTSYIRRDQGNDYGGTTTGLHAITAAAYLSLVGADGLRELGRGIMQRSRYAAAQLGLIDGVRAPAIDAPFFKELVVSFGETGRTVAEVNAHLLERGILGGKDLSSELPELGESALVCVTERHTKADIDGLVAAVAEAVAS